MVVVYAKLGSAFARLGLALDPHDTAGALGDKKIYYLIYLPVQLLLLIVYHNQFFLHIHYHIQQHYNIPYWG